MANDYPAFPKVARLTRSSVLTEKIDGTNALVSVRRLSANGDDVVSGEIVVDDRGQFFGIRAGKRTAWLTGEHDDNFGFWCYVRDNAPMLKRLGEGDHYGEWWGPGIGRVYTITERRFSLFDQRKYVPPGVHQVPVIPTSHVSEGLAYLREHGSLADPGYAQPEGLIVRLLDSGLHYKVMSENDDKHKGELEAGR